MKKILISGSSGFVGSRVLHQWQGRAELFTFPRGSLAAADESAIRRFAETVQPDVILHLAALSDTGYCQQHPEESQRANVELPIWMAKAAQDTGAKLISFSSDQVYAGVTQPGPLPETLPLSPANTYGQHKLEAEERVLALCPEAVLLRAPWMYDLPGDGLPLRGQSAAEPAAGRTKRYSRSLFATRSPGCQLGAGSGGTSLPRLAAARRCVQFWQRERCRYGHNGPAVCRSAGRAGADRAC